MDIWNSLMGMMEVQVTSAEPEALLDAISAANIEICSIQKKSDLIYYFTIPRNKYKAVKGICGKRGDTIKIRKKVGLHWIARNVQSRPLLLGGALFVLILVLWLPSRVFFVQVEGNTHIPDRRILAAAEECGIAFGASRREVRSERLKNALLSAVPELQWAGVNTSGCTAIISVREKAKPEDEKVIGEASSILASRDGYVLSCTATAGSLLVKPGNSVRKGQILISAYTDCGFCIRAEKAMGDVFAQTSRSLETVMLSQMQRKGGVELVKRKFSLLLGKKRIFLWKDSGIWEGSCGRMYEEYYITLPGGFQLPVALCAETYIFCPSTPIEIPQKCAESVLISFTESYLIQHMVAGKICDGIRMITTEDSCYRLTGEYVCEEMIGTVRQKQIGDTNGENS